MRKRKLPGQHLFVLDTNVLMHDPSAIFRFQEHDIFVPMVVLEELDAAKKGLSEVARNARHVSRLLDSLIGEADQDSILAGLPLPSGGGNGNPGRVFFQTKDASHTLPTGGAGKSFPGLTVDQFQRRTSVVKLSPSAMRKSAPIIEGFSKLEGLDAHGRSATIRVEE